MCEPLPDWEKFAHRRFFVYEVVMQLPDELAQALQVQMNVERLNSAIYRSMSRNLENANWPGTAAHFERAAQDEQTHSDKFAAYLIDRNEQPIYAALDAPVIPDEPELLPCMTAALATEQATTAKINALYQLAFVSGDIATQFFLEWFVTEQVDSEREYTDKLLEVSRAQGDTAALLILDREYGEAD